MVKSNKIQNKKNEKNNNTFGKSCVLSYEIYPPNELKLHERKFGINSISGKKYIVTVNRLVNCTCPDCQNRVRRCKHIDFIMNEVLHEKYPKIYYNDKTLEYLFQNLPGNVPAKCD